MKKIWAVLLCGLFISSILGLSVLGAPPRKRGAVPRRPLRVPAAPRIVEPRPMILAPERVIIREPVLIRERPVRQPLPPYSERTSLGGQVVGLSAGMFGGIPSAAVEMWFQNIFDTSKLNLRTGLRYAQGEDTDNVTRKNALAFFDGTYFLVDETGFKTYVGGGLNYLAYTTGQKTGTFGAELYLGMETGSWHSGSVYAEAGYGAIRTGFSPSIKGLQLDIGYKTGM